ncbi:MAG TPA: NAD-dependent epimerase/dehydratase family protein [Candidatus Polarisedimenticolia bacterium]|nr:NAD-dependent epimerase/dehydratase family protein [Candidatus Polarisedimenticolia bacterium]
MTGADGNGGRGGSRREFLRKTAIAAALAGAGAIRPLVAATKAKKSKGDSKKGMSILILGGTRFLGPAIVEAARGRGHTLTLFNRGKSHPGLFPDLENLIGDRDGNLKALEGRRFDAVVDTSGYIPRVVKDSATLLKTSGQYIFISTISVYSDGKTPDQDESGPTGKLDDPTVEKVTGETYGPLKALCEQAAEAAMPGKSTTIRPGLIVGPEDPTDRYTYWPVRVARGGEVMAPGSPDDPVQYIDVRDLGEFTVRAIEERYFGTFNAVCAPMGMGKMLDACNKAGGGKAQFTWVDAAFLDEQKVQAWSDMPVWIPPTGDEAGFSRFSSAKAVKLGLGFRDPVDTARATLDWFKTEPQDRQTGKMKAGVTPERETEVLAAWHAKQPAKG